MVDSSTPAPPPSKLAHWHGRLLLWWARVLHRTVAGKTRSEINTGRRDRAIRASHARGLDRQQIADTLGLDPTTVHKILKKQKTDE